nr:type II toxin-antitoxin system prevent-host-death family antitoxin [uncultured Azospirillum sp.]
MDRIPLSEADGHMAELIERVENGEEIVILRDGKPAVKLVSVADPENPPGMACSRMLGIAKGQIQIADDFDDPLPDDVLKSFYGLAPDEEWPEPWKNALG